MFPDIENKEMAHSADDAQKDVESLKRSREEVKAEKHEQDKPNDIETKEGGHGAAFNTPDWMDD